MQDVLRTAWRCALLDRNAYAGLHFDEYATANAVMLVAGVAAIEALIVAFRSGLASFLLVVIALIVQSLAGWAISTGALWLVSTKLFDGNGRFEQALRMTGYAWLPFLILSVAAAGVFPFPSDRFSILVFVALAWYGAGLYTVGRVLFELQQRNAIAAALLACAGWLLVRTFVFA